MRTNRPDIDGGSITAFVVMLVMMFVACTGLVVDGARVVSAKVALSDHAENAARLGAQEFVSIRGGSMDLNKLAAVRAAQQYLSSNGISGSASSDGKSVTVVVHTTVTMVLLSLVGVGSKSVAARRTALPVDE